MFRKSRTLLQISLKLLRKKKKKKKKKKKPVAFLQTVVLKLLFGEKRQKFARIFVTRWFETSKQPTIFNLILCKHEHVYNVKKHRKRLRAGIAIVRHFETSVILVLGYVRIISNVEKKRTQNIMTQLL